MQRNVNGSGQQVIYVEVKCFPPSSNITSEIYHAIGQYLIYRAFLDERNDTTPLYLAVPETIYNGYFDSIIMRAVRDHQIKLMVVNLEQEKVVLWLP